MTTKRKLSLTKVIQLSRTAMDEGNKIQAIKIVRDYTNLGLLDAKKLVETYDDGTPCRTLAARWERHSKTEVIGYSCAQCDEQMLPGSKPIMIKGHGYCAECAAGAPTLTPTVKDMTAKLKAAKAPQVAPVAVDEQTMTQRIKALVGFEVRDSEGNLLGVFNQYGGVDWVGGAE
jgi:hypothetical protein